MPQREIVAVLVLAAVTAHGVDGLDPVYGGVIVVGAAILNCVLLLIWEAKKK